MSVVFGATGIVGGHIVRQLVLSGERPVALSRSPHRADADVEWIVGDLSRPQGLPLPPIATIYCTAHAGLLGRALPHLRDHGLRRVVLFTSTSIVTKIKSQIDAEREGLARLAEGEKNTIETCDRMGIVWTVLRPTMIYDEGHDANVTRLARFIKRYGFMPLAGVGSGKRQPVHAQDLAVGALQAARSAAAARKIYALPGSDTISYREMTGRIFDSLQKPRRIVTVPPLAWKAAFALAKPLFPNANSAMGDRMAKDMAFDAAPAQQDFDWKPRGFRPDFTSVPDLMT